MSTSTSVGTSLTILATSSWHQLITGIDIVVGFLDGFELEPTKGIGTYTDAITKTTSDKTTISVSRANLGINKLPP